MEDMVYVSTQPFGSTICQPDPPRSIAVLSPLDHKSDFNWTSGILYDTFAIFHAD